MTAKTEKKEKKAFKMPHVLLIIAIVIVLACILSYVVPTGKFDMDEAGNVIPGTYHPVDRAPVNPWNAILLVKSGIEGGASVISLLLISGGLISCIAASGAVNDVLNYGIYKLKDKSVSVLVPSCVALMGLLGCIAGNDALIAFVTMGVVICKKLRLDRICAVGMFYGGIVVGMGATFTNQYVIQGMAGVEPMTGMGARFIFCVLFVGLNAWWCTRYAKKITKDPSKSLCGGLLEPDNDMVEIEAKAFPVRGVLVLVSMVAMYGFYVFVNRSWGWGQEYLIAFQILVAFLAFAIYGKSMNDAAKTFIKGANGMGGTAVIIGCARVIGTVLTKSNVMHTLANGAANIIGGNGLAIAGIGLFIFAAIFNIFIPSKLSKAAVMFPVLTPIGDVCGLTRQMVTIAYQWGDMITDPLTPISSMLSGSLNLAEVEYGKWIKYFAPLAAIYFVICLVAVAVLASMGYVG